MNFRITLSQNEAVHGLLVPLLENTYEMPQRGSPGAGTSAACSPPAPNSGTPSGSPKQRVLLARVGGRTGGGPASTWSMRTPLKRLKPGPARVNVDANGAGGVLPWAAAGAGASGASGNREGQGWTGRDAARRCSVLCPCRVSSSHLCHHHTSHLSTSTNRHHQVNGHGTHGDMGHNEAHSIHAQLSHEIHSSVHGAHHSSYANPRNVKDLQRAPK